MFPGVVPTLPALVEPVALVPSLAPIVTGVSTVDLTAAAAVLVWGIAGLVALRVALSLRRASDEASIHPSSHVAATDPDSGLRKAA